MDISLADYHKINSYEQILKHTTPIHEISQHLF